MRLLLTGATGVAGLNIYRAAVADPAVDRITLLVRREMPSWAVLPPNAAAKTETIIHSDFTSYSLDLVTKIAEHDACIWAQGKSAIGMNETDYTRLTYEGPMAMVKALQDADLASARSADQPFRFVWLSGTGADTSKQMWARVKKRTEDELAATCEATPGMQAHIIRPGGFRPSSRYPEDSPNQRGRMENVALSVLAPVLRFVAPSLMISAEQLSAAALAIAKGLYPTEGLFNNTQLVDIAVKLGVTNKA
ncbi:hypothetical protein EUX98_g6825 [Antrodiella citrinella]|uniref:NAD(P)-binding domain-containing protein n=1 Tax=Antrodiella citrinella TaxID=2447956 RepID=A0A4S4MN10_9APHY|nr:hypothetical protein EUX98_g6825 [Antrodiella citrinella]